MYKKVQAVYELQKQYEKYIKLTNKIQKLFPEYGIKSIYRNLVWANYYLKKYKEVEKLYKKFTRNVFPNYFSNYMTKVYLDSIYRSKQYKKGIEEIDKILTKNLVSSSLFLSKKDMPLLYFNKVVYLAKLKSFKKAFEVSQLLEDKDKNFPELYTTLLNLKKI